MEEYQWINASAITTRQTIRFRRRVDLKTSCNVKKISKTLSKQLFDKWTETCAWLLIQKSTNSLLNNDISPSHSTVCSREGSNHMENRSLVSRLIGGPENVRAAECTRRFNAKIGHSLFHSLFQRDDIVGKSLYETLPTKIQLTQDICGGGIGKVVS